MNETVLEELGFTKIQRRRIVRMMTTIPAEDQGHLLLALWVGNGTGVGAAQWREVAKSIIA